MATSFERKWRKWLGELKERVPLNKPVTVRRIKRPILAKCASAKTPDKLEPQLGTTDLVNGKFLIQISAVESKATQIDTLVHEWAHCVAYEAQRKSKTVWTHDALFGLAYAQVYRAFYEEPNPYLGESDRV